MELLKELNTFMLSNWGVLTSIGIVAWLLVGIILFRKIFVMGLIGCTRREDDGFVVMYTIGCILFWPGYLAWLGWTIIPSVDWRAVFKLPPKPVYITCDGKGGKYKYIGIMSRAPFDRTELGEAILSTGAGTCKGEILKVFNLHNGKPILYTGFTEDCGHRRIYRDTKTDQYYHRTMSDFNARMKKLR